MKSTIERIVVFPLTVPTAWEGRHRRACPIERCLASDRQPWAAIRTGDKRVSIAPIRRVKQFAETGVARRDVGRNCRACFAVDRVQRNVDGIGAPTRSRQWLWQATRRDLKVVVRRERRSNDVNRGYRRERWRTDRERQTECVDAFRLAFNVDQHAARVVAHKPAERTGTGQPMHERAKTDPLHSALNFDEPALQHA